MAHLPKNGTIDFDPQSYERLVWLKLCSKLGSLFDKKPPAKSELEPSAGKMGENAAEWR